MSKFISDSDTGDNSKDGPPRTNLHHFNGGKPNANSGPIGLGGEEASFPNGASPAALTPKQLKKQLKGNCGSPFAGGFCVYFVLLTMNIAAMTEVP